MKLGTYRDNLLWRRGASPVRFWNRSQRRPAKFGFGLNDERKRSAVAESGWTLAIIDQTLLGVRCVANAVLRVGLWRSMYARKHSANTVNPQFVGYL